MTKAQQFAERIKIAGPRPICRGSDGVEYAAILDNGNLLLEREIPHGEVPGVIAFLTEYYTERHA